MAAAHRSRRPAGPHSPPVPALIRLVSYATLGHFLVADVVAQVFAGAASAVAVWTLAARIRDRRTADRAVLLYCACPGAMTFGMLYPEPLAVALAAGSLLAVLSRKWLIAALLAMLATAAHPTLTVLIPVLGIIALHAIWTKRDWRSLIAPVVAPLGILGYFAYYGHQYHDYLFWFRIERAGWHQHIDWGIHELHVITWTDPPTTAHPSLQRPGDHHVLGFGHRHRTADRRPRPLARHDAHRGRLPVLRAVRWRQHQPRFVLTMFGIFIGAGAKPPRYLFWPTLVVFSAGLLAFVIGWWPHNLPPSP